MRIVAALIFLVLLQLISAAQNGWIPLSREVERNYAFRLNTHKAEMHTAIRPWRTSEVLARMTNDTLTPSAIALLDKWAGVYNGRKFRWGPLVDASAGYDLDDSTSGGFYRAGAGLWLDADVGKRLNFHIDGQAWQQRFPAYLDRWVSATQVTPGEGYAYGGELDRMHYDWNGHMSWDPSRHFNITVGRGKNSFGEGYRSLMLSNEAQGYPYLRITTTVWKVKYVNLYAVMNDIRGAGGDPTKFHRKYAAMHYLSWNATRRINVSIFEAIILDGGTEKYRRGFDAHYANPVIFYRPVEYHTGSPDNALLGMSINVKAGRSTTIYSQFVLDEFLMVHVRNGTGWYANKQSIQLGLIGYNSFAIDGLTLRGEWNYIRPFMYTHIHNVQNYAHMGQPLAHPMGSNVHELIGHADLERKRMLYSVRLSMCWMGSDSVGSYGSNIFRPDTDRPRNPSNSGPGTPINFGYYHGDHISVNLLHAEFRAAYLLDRNTGMRLEASYLFRYRSSADMPSTMSNVFRLGITCYFRDRYPEQDVRYFLD